MFFGEELQEAFNENKITKEMVIGEILKVKPEAVAILMQSGMHCLGCPSSQMESLEEACMVHGIDVEALLIELNK